MKTRASGVICLGFLLAVHHGTADTYLVTNSADSGEGSLRQAIVNANNHSGSGTIVLTNLAEPITLASALPVLMANITVLGNGSRISGNTNLRVLEIAAGVTATIRDLTIADGYTTNGGGAGILNKGNLTLVDSSIISNTAIGLPGGGGIANHGTLAIHSSTIVGNSSLGSAPFQPYPDSRGAKGGGIFSDGSTLVVSNSALIGNVVSAGASYMVIPSGMGGGVFLADGQVAVANTLIASNACTGGFVSFSGTTGSQGGNGLGGGIYQEAGSLRLTNCTITANRAAGLGGAPGNHNGGQGGAGYGGGIFAVSAVDFVNCTLSRNTAQGGNGGPAIDYGGGSGGGALGAGLFGTGVVALVNCTMSGNAATGGAGGYSSQGWGGYGGDARGGGIYAPLGELTSINCTLISNAVVAGVRGTGYLANGSAGVAAGPGVAGTSNSVATRNTILQAGSYGFRSQGHNLFEGMNSTDPSDIFVTVLALGPLRNNGGPTFTHALPPNSPAVDAGTTAGALPFDQRGLPRQGWAVDIGAYELQQPKAPRLSGLWQQFGFSLTITGDVGSRYQIDSATILKNWAPVSVVTNSSGTVQFTDFTATNRAQQFYRALLLP